ncbi:MAG: peptidoglycan DD-metalloendopeptidase family protein [Patescibacteria group bacterium]|nr:peptidoglycan DD-metalloendopeptidase family protein [Patescibacteria group bacterium]
MIESILAGIVKPLRGIARFIFQHNLVPLYRVYLNAKKVFATIFAPAKNKIIYPLLSKSTIHVVIAVLAVAVIANNVFVKETRAEEFGQKTILASMITDTQDADIVEGAITAQVKEANYYRDSGVVPLVGQFSLDQTITGGEGNDEILTSESSAAVVKPNIAQTKIGQRPREQVVYYIVEGGDTVSSIAQKFGISTNTILWENKLGPRDYIKPGNKLTILPASGVSHQVQSGDTVDKIAKKYKVDANSILEYNKLADASAIEKDQILLIPGGTIEAPVVVPSNNYGSTQYSGSIPANATPSGTKLQWPTTGHKINQYYKWRHLAIDIGGNYSSPLYAADDGRVEASGWGTGYGNRVIVNHGNGIKTLYAHASKLFVNVGDSVKRGQTIGMMGCTGWCTGPHIHFEVIVNGSKVNPLSYL